jgi:hypothetical protein
MKTQISKQHHKLVEGQSKVTFHNEDRTKMNSLTTLKLGILLAMLVTMTLSVMPAMAQSTSLRFASTTGQLYMTGSSWAEITGLVFNIPPAPSGGPPTTALVTLNVPAPYATGTNAPGGCFGISATAL